MNKDDKIAKASGGELDLALDLAKLYIASYIANERIIDNTRAITSLLTKQRKSSNYAYNRAIAKKEQDEQSWRLDRILKKLRQTYSADNYKEVLRATAGCSRQERWLFIRKMERVFGYSQHR